MGNESSELLEKIRQQFDFSPYPNVPLENSPKGDFNTLYVHNWITSFYLRNQALPPVDEPLILDAGCGTGYKSLILAEANPNAKIVGIDLSKNSVDLAQARLTFHGFSNTEFHTIGIQDLPILGLKFDYINCDDVLYLLDDPLSALQTFKLVLKPHGIIRGNLHSALERADIFRVQRIFKLMGLLDHNPEEMEMEMAIDAIKALKDQVNLKARTWTGVYEQADSRQVLLMNYLFQGDKGYTIPDLFNLIQQSDLEFISMVNWRHWELIDLFQNPDDLPVLWGLGIPELTTEQRLHLFELLQPIHRLLDFWCGHPEQAQPHFPVSEWQISDWNSVRVHLHPQLNYDSIKTHWMECISQQKSVDISHHLSFPVNGSFSIESSLAACLLPLFESPQPVPVLVDRWLKIKPCDLITLEASSYEQAYQEITTLLAQLEVFLYVLLEKNK